MFVPGKPFQPNLMFVSKAINYPRVKHLSNAPLLGKLHALPTNNRLGWKVLQWTNTSLLQKVATYDRKKFYNIVTRTDSAFLASWAVDCDWLKICCKSLKLFSL